MTRRYVSAIFAAIALSLPGIPPAHAQVTPPNPPFMSYAAKFVCGTQTKDLDVVRGIYASAINVHNPQAKLTLTLYKKAVVAFPERSSVGPVSAFAQDILQPDQAIGVDCTDIRNLFGSTTLPTHIEGFLVIEIPAPNGQASAPQLDVIGKYTVRHTNTTGTDASISDANGIDVVPYTGKFITQ
jgi:hypothetical protein